VIDTDLERRKKKKEGGIIGMEFPRVLLSPPFFSRIFQSINKMDWGDFKKGEEKRG
jgi:hypothetical protein